MRVGLFSDTYYPEINGVATSVYQLKQELEANGNEVYVFTVSNPLQKEKEDHVYRIKSLPFFLLKDRRMAYSFAVKWYQIIEKLNLDVIHTQTEFCVGHIGRKAAEKFHIPLVHTYHTIYEDYTHYLKVPGNQKMKGMVRVLSRICLNRADLVVVPTEKVRNIILGYGVKKDIVVQPTGISLGKFKRVDVQKVSELKQELGLVPENHVLISLGRLSHEKNISELIKFLKRLVKVDKNIRLVIVGDGPEKPVLETMVRDFGLENYVIFTGEAPWDQVQNYYALGDVFVSASTSETQGLTYAEALAAGKPLLVRKDDCLEEVLQPGINGYAYSNEEEFIDYYKTLFFKSGVFDEKVIRDSIERLSAESFGRNMEQIYRNAMRSYDVLKGNEQYEVTHRMAE